MERAEKLLNLDTHLVNIMKDLILLKRKIQVEIENPTTIVALIDSAISLIEKASDNLEEIIKQEIFKKIESLRGE